jgi:hypothetical protein
MDGLFAFHRLNESGQTKAQFIALEFDHLLDRLRELCGEPGNASNPLREQSREFFILRTKLEEASMFAKKCMAMKLENQNHTEVQSLKPA